MSLELMLVIIFGTLSCILGAIQLWISLHQYWFWLLHLRRNAKSLGKPQMDSIDLYMDMEGSHFAPSSGSFATCMAESLSIP